MGRDFGFPWRPVNLGFEHIFKPDAPSTPSGTSCAAVARLGGGFGCQLFAGVGLGSPCVSQNFRIS